MQRMGLIAAVLAAGLAGALAAKLHTRWTGQCGPVSCGYAEIQLALIRQRIASHGTGPAYLVVGDSLTEIGRWPTMCGHDPVVAGISGAGSDTWLAHAKAVADALKPEFIVLALGTNDVLTQGRLGPYEQVVSSLAGYRLVAVPVHGMPRAPQEAVRDANSRIKKAVGPTVEAIDAMTTDGVHLTAKDYARWFDAIEKVACRGNLMNGHGPR
jgi:hypothetical protein